MMVGIAFPNAIDNPDTKMSIKNANPVRFETKGKVPTNIMEAIVDKKT